MTLELHHLRIPFLSSEGSAIWNQHLVFESGKFYHIHAVSGKGKSTLIQTLYGIHQEYHGEMHINQKPIVSGDLTHWTALRSQVLGIVFQDLRLIPELTVLQNIELKRNLNPVYPKEHVLNMLAQLGLEKKTAQACKTLSYGERQRVALVRALSAPFQFLFLDEPFSHLDHKNIERAITLIDTEVRKRSAALLLADLEVDSYFPYHQKLSL